MEKKADQIHEEDWLKNLPVQAEDFAFKPEEMILCDECKRTNPPTRLACFYCGKELEISEAQSRQIKPNLRKLESWEKGFNLIYAPSAKILDEANLTEIAKLVNLEKTMLEKICAAKTSLPVARIESEKEAKIVQNRLCENGFETFVLSDENLVGNKPPRRLYGLEFWNDKLILIFFNSDEIAEVALKDVVLIVSGAIFERKTESLEKRKKGENTLLKATETASDEMLFDIYSRESPNGYRIFAKGFDFSCLEAEKEMLAKDNLKKLARKLQNLAPNAKLIENYLQIRESLGSVWEAEEINDAKGVTRRSFGRFNLGNTTIVSNWTQFNKFSRLQWYIL